VRRFASLCIQMTEVRRPRMIPTPKLPNRSGWMTVLTPTHKPSKSGGETERRRTPRTQARVHAFLEFVNKPQQHVKFPQAKYFPAT
jgi:hypothetical protein